MWITLRSETGSLIVCSWTSMIRLPILLQPSLAIPSSRRDSTRSVIRRFRRLIYLINQNFIINIKLLSSRVGWYVGLTLRGSITRLSTIISPGWVLMTESLVYPISTRCVPMMTVPGWTGYLLYLSFYLFFIIKYDLIIRSWMNY